MENNKFFLSHVKGNLRNVGVVECNDNATNISVGMSIEGGY